MMREIAKRPIVSLVDRVNAVRLYYRYGKYCVTFETDRGSCFQTREYDTEEEARRDFDTRQK